MLETVLDTGTALERVDGDFDFLCELVDLFLEDTVRLVEEIHTASVRRDGPRLARAAHSIKGAAANVSAIDVFRAAAALEDLGNAQNWRECAHRCSTLQNALTQLRDVRGTLEWPRRDTGN